MPDEAEFRIRVTTAGANEAASSIRDVESASGDLGRAADATGEAAESAAPKLGKMVEEAGGMRESQRLARELFEALRGGDESIAGLSGILRYALISSEALSVAGPIGMAVAALGTSFISLWALHAAKSGEAKDKVKGDLDDTATSAKTYVEDVKNAFSGMDESGKTAFGSIDTMYQGMIAQINAAISATKELQRAQDELKSAKLAAQIAQLDSQEEEEEAGKTPDQQAVIKRRFTAQRLNVRQQFDQDQANAQIADVKNDLGQAQSALELKQKELEDKEAKYEDLLKNADNAAQGLASSGAQSDADYAESQVGILRQKRQSGIATQDDLSKLDDLEDTAPLLRQKENESGKSFTEEIARLTAALTADEKTAHDHPEEEVGVRAATEAQDIKDQLQAIAYYQSAMKALADATKANSKDQLDGQTALTELKGKIDALTVRVQAAELKASTRVIVDATQQAQQQQTDLDAQIKHAFEMRQAERDANIKRLLAESENPLATPDQRAADKAQVDQITAQGDQDKLANANALGLSDADRIRLGGDSAGDQTKAENVVAGQQQKDQSGQLKSSLEKLKSLSDKPFMDHVNALLATVNTVADKQGIVNGAFMTVLANHSQRLNQHSAQLDDQASRIKHLK